MKNNRRSPATSDTSRSLSSGNGVVPAALREPDASRYTGYSRAYLRRARLLGEGPRFIRVRRSITYRVADLDAWLAAHLVKTAE